MKFLKKPSTSDRKVKKKNQNNPENQFWYEEHNFLSVKKIQL